MSDGNIKKRTMKIVEKRHMTHNTFFMKVESDEDLPQAKVSFHVLVFDDRGQRKPYSPLYVSKRHIAFAIKVYPEGTLSTYLCNKSVNDTITVSEAVQVRENRLNEFRNVLMIAGGTGVTPMFQLLREHILSGINATDFTLLFLNRTDKDVFLQSELETLKKKSNGKLQIIHIFSQGTEFPDSQHISGTLTKDMLLTVIRSKMFEFVYICGPPSLYDSFSGRKKSKTEQGELTGVLKEVGYTERNVYKF
ncbi:uncharacterized protein VICG_02041 [Vittaforma corneae ATCC 50505]|uniref:FAD-binding FR-type domain-containing protein n=1 Tax=Vittaforma corneae (strain ATCC 50505) TaxID=993615 RepID=L2GJ59_VITCO|nr:uncharacterized protein VICG_02041 [Vittaforma corneae ATCC 50505]ELA40901.1 hypothetical protein VICG_02041 [Vittaforma corneae ATCC 50505]